MRRSKQAPQLRILSATLWLSVAAIACSTSTPSGNGGSGGEKASGGTLGSGGQPGTGGASGTGGRIGSGGTLSSGGVGSGGQPGTGGTGGHIGSGGVSAVGGTSTDGGRSGTGGATTGGQLGNGGSTIAGSIDGGTSSGAAGPSAGCGKTPTLQNSPGTTKNYNKVASGRQYILRLPDNYDNNHPYRLILSYHWATGSASQVFDCKTEGIPCYTTQSPFFGLLALANNTTIFIAPDGTGGLWSNTGGADVTFTDDILKQVEADLCIDTTRVELEGFSMGGAMAFTLVCARPDVFHRAQPAADAERNKDRIGYAPHHVQHDVPALVAGRNIQKNQLVGPFLLVPRSHLHRITRIAEIHEIRPLNNPPAIHIQAGYHSFCKH